MEFGGNHVAYVENSSQSRESIGISQKEPRDPISPGADCATSEKRLSVKESVIRICHRCGKHIGFYPTQKPEALYERLVLATTNEGDVVVDSYMGSGTMPAVCSRLNRTCIGIDSNPEAITVAKTRLGIA
jgi:DNA modification methylase